jgi:GH24 family phage-related lysozyme (muramidase)
MNKAQVVAQLQFDEGFAPQSYFDNDQWTYGWGCKAPGPGAFITKEKALPILVERVQMAIDDFYDVFAGCVMSERREHAFVNMAFNLGETKLRNFKKMVAAVQQADWGHAAFEAVHSKWFEQLSIQDNKKEERAERIVLEILRG